VWAAGDDDLYVVMAQSGKVFHSTDRVKSWTTLTPGLSTNAVSVSGSDGKTVYVAGSSGDIALGSASSSWTGDHAADGTAWAQLDANSGVVLGTRASEVDLRTGPGAWSPLLDETGIATFHAVWGTSASDFYAAGQKMSCSTTGSCGVVYQKVGNSPPVPSTVSGCDSFNGVFGMSGGTIYAVCDSGIIATSESGGAFTASIYGPAQLNGVHGAAGELYAVGVAGTIMHIIE
jgi:hypothetical protein